MAILALCGLSCSMPGANDLFEALKTGDIPRIRACVDSGADVNARHEYGMTPLFVAAQNGYAEIIELLLAAKTDLNCADKPAGATPLWQAAQNGHTEVVRILLAAGADVNARAHHGGRDHTPLSVAREMGHGAIVTLLRDHGATETTSP